MFSALRVCIRAVRRSPNTYAVIVGLILVIYPPFWFAANRATGGIAGHLARQDSLAPLPWALRLLPTARELSDSKAGAALILLETFIGVALIVLGLSRALKSVE